MNAIVKMEGQLIGSETGMAISYIMGGLFPNRLMRVESLIRMLLKRQNKVNVFVLAESPFLSAKYHCDRHVIKMILESAQLLCTAHRVLDGSERSGKSPSGRAAKRWVLPDQITDGVLYTATHVNHQCAQWVRESVENYEWLVALMIELNKEFVRRYNKRDNHASIQRLGEILLTPPKNIPRKYFTEPPQCMPDQYKCRGDVVQAYRNYYCGDKVRFATWTNAPIPDWFLSDTVSYTGLTDSGSITPRS